MPSQNLFHLHVVLRFAFHKSVILLLLLISGCMTNQLRLAILLACQQVLAHHSCPLLVPDINLAQDPKQSLLVDNNIVGPIHLTNLL